MDLSEETLFVRTANLKWRVYLHVPKVTSLNLAVVFFHGASFSIDDWIRIGTLKLVRESGFQVVALDLPRGRASKTDKLELKKASDYNPLLEEVLVKAGIPKDRKIVLIGPSMGAGFAMSFALGNPEKVTGLVLIAPSLRDLSEDAIRSLKPNIPVLIVWGDRDDVFPLDEYAKPLQNLLPHAKLMTLKGARHAAYLDKPEEFHKSLLEFLIENESTRK